MRAAVLTNVLFWSGVAIGGVVFAALLEVTSAKWSGPLRLTAERFRRFLPVSLLAFAVVARMRVVLACSAVYACAFVFCRASLRARENPAQRSAVASAVVLLIVYAFGFSLVAVDAIMSLEPRWTSTLFPAYVFTGNVYAGIAAVAAVAAWPASRRGVMMTPPRSRDMANLLAGVALFWIYLFWSQFLVIWYGNLADEVRFISARVDGMRALSWIVLLTCGALPALTFVPRRGKRAGAVSVVAPLALTGMWLERWILVAPDLQPHTPAAIPIVTALFAAAFWIAVRPLTGDARTAMRVE